MKKEDQKQSKFWHKVAIVVIVLLVIVLVVFKYSGIGWKNYEYKAIESGERIFSIKFPPWLWANDSAEGLIGFYKDCPKKQETCPYLMTIRVAAPDAQTPQDYESQLLEAVNANPNPKEKYVPGFTEETIEGKKVYFFNDQNKNPDELTAVYFTKETSLTITYNKDFERFARVMIRTLEE